MNFTICKYLPEPDFSVFAPILRRHGNHAAPSATRTPTVSETVARSRRCCRRDAGRRTRRCCDTRGRTGARRAPGRRGPPCPNRLPACLHRSAALADCLSARRNWDGKYQPWRPGTIPRLGDLQPSAPGHRSGLCLSCLSACSRDRRRPWSACSKPACGRPIRAPSGSARITRRAAASRVGAVHGRISARAHRLPGSAAPSAGGARRVLAFIPHDADASGLPAAVLRYTVTNPGRHRRRVDCRTRLDNPLLTFRVAA